MNNDELLSNEEIRIPVIAEQLEAGTKEVVTGRVRVRKTVHSHDEVIDQPLHREDVEVRRVIKNEVVDGPLPVRHSGDTTIVPVVKEILRIEKQWVLTEELHIVKRTTEERFEQRVTVSEEQAEVARLEGEGHPVGEAESGVLFKDPLRGRSE